MGGRKWGREVKTAIKREGNQSLIPGTSYGNCKIHSELPEPRDEGAGHLSSGPRSHGRGLLPTVFIPRVVHLLRREHSRAPRLQRNTLAKGVRAGSEKLAGTWRGGVCRSVQGTERHLPHLRAWM